MWAQSLVKTTKIQLVVVAHTFNPSTRETELSPQARLKLSSNGSRVLVNSNTIKGFTSSERQAVMNTEFQVLSVHRNIGVLATDLVSTHII